MTLNGADATLKVTGALLAKGVTLGTSGSFVDTTSNDTEISGLITGSGSTTLTKTGSNVLNLSSGSNSVQGFNATVSAGAFSIASASNVGSGTLS